MRLAVDHAIPLTVIADKIKEIVCSEGKITTRRLEAIHRESYLRILITAEEHERLDKVDKQERYGHGNNWRKRYKEAKIATFTVA